MAIRACAPRLQPSVAGAATANDAVATDVFCRQLPEPALRKGSVSVTVIDDIVEPGVCIGCPARRRK